MSTALPVRVSRIHVGFDTRDAGLQRIGLNNAERDIHKNGEHWQADSDI